MKVSFQIVTDRWFSTDCKLTNEKCAVFFPTRPHSYSFFSLIFDNEFMWFMNIWSTLAICSQYVRIHNGIKVRRTNFLNMLSKTIPHLTLILLLLTVLLLLLLAATPSVIIAYYYSIKPQKQSLENFRISHKTE